MKRVMSGFVCLLLVLGLFAVNAQAVDVVRQTSNNGSRIFYSGTYPTSLSGADFSHVDSDGTKFYVQFIVPELTEFSAGSLSLTENHWELPGMQMVNTSDIAYDPITKVVTIYLGSRQQGVLHDIKAGSFRLTIVNVTM